MWKFSPRLKYMMWSFGGYEPQPYRAELKRYPFQMMGVDNFWDGLFAGGDVDRSG